jgi:hypothetical protein
VGIYFKTAPGREAQSRFIVRYESPQLPIRTIRIVVLIGSVKDPFVIVRLADLIKSRAFPLATRIGTMLLSGGLIRIDSRRLPIIRITLAIRRLPIGLLGRVLTSTRFIVMLIAIPRFIFALFHGYLLIEFNKPPTATDVSPPN